MSKVLAFRVRKITLFRVRKKFSLGAHARTPRPYKLPPIKVPRSRIPLRFVSVTRLSRSIAVATKFDLNARVFVVLRRPCSPSAAIRTVSWPKQNRLYERKRESDGSDRSERPKGAVVNRSGYCVAVVIYLRTR